MIHKAVFKIIKWFFPVVLLIALTSVALTASVASLQAESLPKAEFAIAVDESVDGEQVNRSHHYQGDSEGDSNQWWQGMGGMMEGGDHDMGRWRNHFEHLAQRHGYWIFPVAGILIFLGLSMGILAIVFSLILAVLLVFVVIKILQSMVDGGESEAVKADMIGVNVYYLYLAGFLLPILSLAGVIVAYIYQGRASDWMKSHYRFQIRTFWIGLLYCTVSSILTMVLIGLVGYAFVLVWVIVRSVQGIRAFNKSEPIAKPGTWLWN